jgi:hypothetical protein
MHVPSVPAVTVSKARGTGGLACSKVVKAEELIHSCDVSESAHTGANRIRPREAGKDRGLTEDVDAAR